MKTNKPDVQQYSPIAHGGRSAWMQEDDFGGWVRAVNYEALQAECEKLRKDAARLDWLADPENQIGEVLLPSEAVEQNPHSMRAAIDAAMEMK